ncbi:MAG: hypothetical protein BWY15_01091 [Firmicutes bacterium ADurb.Bin193]|nr:MAG: hypothetical protein BWY15_01091 [Firmicutes bacterium ADurb.Bin193]
MPDIKTGGIGGSIDIDLQSIASLVSSAVSGFEKARAVISGFYDVLIKWVSIQKQTDNYVTELKRALKEEYDGQIEFYNNQLSDLRQSYYEKEYKREQARRDTNLKELNALALRYKDAVTKEGKEKYRDIMSRIADITDDSRKDEARLKLGREEEEIKGKISVLKDEYQKSLSLVEQWGESSLGVTKGIILDAVASATEAGNSIEKIMLGINRSFSNQVEELFEKTKMYMSVQADKIARIFEAVHKYSQVGIPPLSATSVSVTFNDYGDKHLENSGAVEGYAQEFLGVVKNALRTDGIK